MTVSADQTTRIHAPWVQLNQSSIDSTWHELARPQIHGYDMQALALLSRYRFASGAEEKIVRTFGASRNFVESLKRITKLSDKAENIASIIGEFNINTKCLKMSVYAFQKYMNGISSAKSQKLPSSFL